jgi:ribosomal protein L21E
VIANVLNAHKRGDIVEIELDGAKVSRLFPANALPSGATGGV